MFLLGKSKEKKSNCKLYSEIKKKNYTESVNLKILAALGSSDPLLRKWKASDLLYIVIYLFSLIKQFAATVGEKK